MSRNVKYRLSHTEEVPVTTTRTITDNFSVTYSNQSHTVASSIKKQGSFSVTVTGAKYWVACNFGIFQGNTAVLWFDLTNPNHTNGTYSGCLLKIDSDSNQIRVYNGYYINKVFRVDYDFDTKIVKLYIDGTFAASGSIATAYSSSMSLKAQASAIWSETYENLATTYSYEEVSSYETIENTAVKNIKFYDMAGEKPNIVLNGDNGSHTYAGTVPITVPEFTTTNTNYIVSLLHLNDSNEPFYDEAFENSDYQWGNYNWTAYGSPTLTETNAKFGKALQFNGGQGLFSKWAGGTSEVPFSIENRSYTVDFWAYIDSTGSSNGVLAKFFWSTQVDGPFLMISRDNNKLSLTSYPFNSNTLPILTVSSTSDVPLDQVIHVAVVYQYCSKFLLYLNGQKEAEIAATARNYNYFSGSNVKSRVSIGYYLTDFSSGSGNRFFKGTIGEFRVSNTDLFKGNFAVPTRPATVNGITRIYTGNIIANPLASNLRIHLADGSVKAIAATKQTPTLQVSKTSLTLNSVGSTDTIVIDTDSDGEIEVSTDNTDIISTSLRGGRLTVTNVKGSGTAIIFVQVSEGREFEASEVKTITVGAYNWGALNEHTPKEIQSAIRLKIAPQLWAAGDVTDSFTIARIQVGGYYKSVGNGGYALVGNYLFGGAGYRAMILGINHNPQWEGDDSIHFCLDGSANWRAFTDKYYNKSLSYSAKNSAHAAFTVLHHKATQSNKGGWSKSVLADDNGNFENHLPYKLYHAIAEQWREVIYPRQAKYTDNRTDRSVKNVGTGTDITATFDSFFLLSEYEVFGEITHSHPDEAMKQAQYDWFKYRTRRYPEGYANNDLVTQYKNNDLEYVCWWLRSPRFADNKRYCRVNTEGQPSYKVADASSAIVPCFVIK